MEENNKQNIQIAEVKKDVSWIKAEIIGIKKQVFNHLPTELDKCVKKTDFGVGIAIVIGVQILMKFF